METRSYTVYAFDELSPEAQKNALDKNRDINVDGYSDWTDSVVDSLIDDLEKSGISYKGHSYSGFYSQGDGASVEYSIEDLALFADACFSDSPEDKVHSKTLRRALRWCPDVIDRDTRTNLSRGFSNYTGYAPIEFSVNAAFGYRVKYISALMDRLNEASESFHSDICHDFYRKLEEEYDYLTSDEVVKEALTANDYLFTASGVID